jgi:hypothetical protein
MLVELVTMRQRVGVACFYTLSWHSSGGTRNKIGDNKEGAQYFVGKLPGKSSFGLPITRLADTYN